MREFSSGIVGCIICILALMGSVLGGFCLGGESGIRDVTNYDYKTDLTGTFATDNAPEYIDYSPAANFMGYSRNSVEYSKSNTANAYRYIVSYPNDRTINSVKIDYNDYLASSNDFLTSKLNTQLVLNVTGGGYDYGSAKTSNGITYNVFCNNTTISGHPDIPKVGYLYYVLNPYRGQSNNITIDITNSGDHPLLMTTATFVSGSLSDNPNTAWRVSSTTIPSHPTRIEWNTIIDDVSVYNGSTLLFTEKLNKILVYNTYQYDAGGTPKQAYVNATFTLHLRNTIIDGVDEEYTYSPNPETSIFLNNNSPNHGYPTTPLAIYSGNNGYNTFARSAGAATLSGMMSHNNVPTNRIIEIQFTYFNSFADIIFINYNNLQNLTSQSGYVKYGNVTDANFPSSIIYNNGQCTVYYNNGSNSWSANASDIYVVYRPVDITNVSNYHDYDVYTNMIYIWETTTTLSITSNTNLENYQFSSSNMGTPVLIDWNGSINMGLNRNYAGIGYELSIPRTLDTPNVSTLYRVLEKMRIETFTSIDLTLTYGSTPVLFYAGDFTRTELTIGNSTQHIYTATLNENNSMPDRLVITSGIAQMFKNNVLIGTKSIDKIYVINNSYYKLSDLGNPTIRGASVTFNGTATTDVTPVSLTVDNNSSYPSDGYNFTLPASEHPGSPRYIRPLLQYTGSQFNNLGDPVTFNAINKTANIMLSNGEVGNTTYYLTKFTNILNSINMETYNSVELDIYYGTHPIIFIRGSWEYYYSHQTYTEQGGTVHYYYNYYWQSIDDTAFPDKIKIDKATYRVSAYKNGNEIWHANANDLQIAYKYWTLDDLGVYDAYDKIEVTDQRMNMSGLGSLIPTYGYANPSKGIILKTPFTEWSNGYKNNEINITLTKQNGANNDMTITAGNASIRLDRNVLTDQMTATVTKHDGTVETRNLGKWHNAQITINASAGTVAFTPIPGTGMPNFTNPVELNDTTITWDNWYNGGDIETLTFSTSGKSFRWSVTSTSVFLDTYGIVMTNPSVNVTDYFPEMENWRLNFFSFALLGNSMTVNDITFPVDQTTGRITVVDKDGKTTTADLNNVYVTKENGHTYFNFANEDKSIDLGETVNDRVSFTGLWYFTTGLFEVTQGTEKYYDWQIDGQLHATLPQMCLMFIGILIAGLIICKAILRFEIGLIDWVILISATVISLIVAGGNL